MTVSRSENQKTELSKMENEFCKRNLETLGRQRTENQATTRHLAAIDLKNDQRSSGDQLNL